MSIKRSIVLSITFLVVIASGLYLYTVYFPRPREPGIPKHVWTHATMRQLALGISMLVDDGHAHPVDIEEISNILAYDGGINYSNEGKAFIDVWGMPILIKYEQPATYRFISYGPNKEDDNGIGDDLMKAYDVSGGKIKEIK